MPLPTEPFDGQEFIDAARVKWAYSSTDHSWRKIGIAQDIPLVSGTDIGLLSARFKEFVDGIPERAGHFGIITKPLLSVVPLNHTNLVADKISKTVLAGADLQIDGQLVYTPDVLGGKLVHFLTGKSRTKLVLILSNDQNGMIVSGQPDVQAGDQFEVVEPDAINPNGVISGDIKLLSDSLKLSCVNSDGEELDSSCGDKMCAVTDPAVTPPGLNFEVDNAFLDAFCIEIPGCTGPKGAKGKPGPQGRDGTGDGPVGAVGQKGRDASSVPNKLTGIKIVDVDDVYDSAVVDIELDAAVNKLNLVKAKIKVADNEAAATQIIASPLDRSIEFNGSGFAYSLKAPTNDVYGTDDVDIVFYPHGANVIAGGLDSVTVGTIKLGMFIDDVIASFQGKLDKASAQYMAQIKQYVEGIDKEARQILAGLAKELADCEFQLPIDFCLGIAPGNCQPNEGGTNFIGGMDQPATPGTPITPPPYVPGTPNTPGTPVTDGNTTLVPVSKDGNATLPAGRYILTYLSGGVRSSWRPSGLGASSVDPPYQIDQYIVGTSLDGFGLEAILMTGEVRTIKKFPNVNQVFTSSDSCQAAYESAGIESKSLAIDISSGTGTITLRLITPGNVAQGGVNLSAMWYPPA